MSATFAFPQPLSEKYRPRVIGDFAGLEKPKQILGKFAANPYSSAWLFVGPPGVGKTTMALALAEMLRAESHHISSQQCNVGARDPDGIHRRGRTPFHIPGNQGPSRYRLHSEKRPSPGSHLRRSPRSAFREYRWRSS